MKKKISEKTSQIEQLEEKYLNDKISTELFEKYSIKYKAELAQLTVENEQNEFSSSNLENAVNKGLEIAQNISQLWLSSDFTNKQQLQYLIYPGGILYSKENDTVRTPKPNTIFAAIPPLVGILEDKKIGNLIKDCLT